MDAPVSFPAAMPLSTTRPLVKGQHSLNGPATAASRRRPPVQDFGTAAEEVRTEADFAVAPPAPVRLALRMGGESVAVRLAVHWGQRDEDTLTNMVFFHRHPARGAARLRRNEPGFERLRREWLSIRDTIVRPVLAASSPPRTPAVKAPSASDSRRGEPEPVNPKRTDSLERGVKSEATQPFKPEPGEWRDVVLAATAAAEGSYDTVNMYDVGILSWGIMQWTLHQGSLQDALAFIKERLEPELWSQLFPGLDVRRIDGRNQIVYRGQLVLGQSALRQVFRGRAGRGDYDWDVISRWAHTFALAGRHPRIKQLQREYGRRRVDAALDTHLGEMLSRFKRNQCPKPGNKTWQWVCGELSQPPAFYPSRYRRIGDYVGSDLKAVTLFFGMWTQNPASALLHLKKAIDRLADRYGSYDPEVWPAGWRKEFNTMFEQVLRASGFAYWGDAKAKKAGRPSRTEKILSKYQELTGRK